MKYKHYILTRFNIPIKYGRTERYYFPNKVENSSICLDEEYLAVRFNLFEETALKSIDWQSDQRFEWLVFFYDKTPVSFKEKIAKWEKKYSWFSPQFLNEQKTANINDYISELIRNSLNDEDAVITSRIDNDDLIHPEYIKNIHSYLDTIDQIEEMQVISYPLGINYVKKLKYGTYTYMDNNHFISLLAANDNQKISHIFMWNHGEIFKSINNKKILCNSEPMWVEYIHETNYSNELNVTNRRRLVWDYSKVKCDMDIYAIEFTGIFGFYIISIVYFLFAPIVWRVRNYSKKYIRKMVEFFRY